MEDFELVLLGLKSPKNHIKRKCCVIYPNDNIKVSWDIVVALILLISSFTTPIDLAFQNINEDSPGFRYL
jgi:hypothetical protein